ncbi:MAG: patatin-like phospholipase family protein [Planctomycetota bacterium]
MVVTPERPTPNPSTPTDAASVRPTESSGTSGTSGISGAGQDYVAPGQLDSPGRTDLARFNWAFALSGGGAMGAYTAGVIEAFRERGMFSPGHNVRIIHGVSTGALIANFVALREFSQLRHIYRTVHTADVLAPNHRLLYNLAGGDILPVLAACVLAGPPYIFSTAPLRRLVASVMGQNDERFGELIALRDRMDVGYSAADMQTGELHNITNQDPGITPVAMREGLLASTNQPVLMDLVSLGQDRAPHCDGGVRELLPLQRIYRSPFADTLDVIVCVILDPVKPLHHDADWVHISDILKRTIELLSFSVGEHDLERATLLNVLFRCRHTIITKLGEDAWHEIEDGLPIGERHDLRGLLEPFPRRAYEIIRIHPDHLDFVDPMRFVPGEMRRAYDLAMADTHRILAHWWKTRGQHLQPAHADVPWPHAGQVAPM